MCKTAHFGGVMSDSAKMIAVVGRSQSGKTTLIRGLVSTLKARGYRVGTVKHTHHGFDMDKPGSDTDQHRAAGADTVVAVGPEAVAMLKRGAVNDPASLAGYFTDVDVVLVEGFKGSRLPKIEVCRRANGKAPLDLNPRERLAFVSDQGPLPGAVNVDLGAIETLADLIKRHLHLQ